MFVPAHKHYSVAVCYLTVAVAAAAAVAAAVVCLVTLLNTTFGNTHRWVYRIDCNFVVLDGFALYSMTLETVGSFDMN